MGLAERCQRLAELLNGEGNSGSASAALDEMRDNGRPPRFDCETNRPMKRRQGIVT